MLNRIKLKDRFHLGLAGGSLLCLFSKHRICSMEGSLLQLCNDSFFTFLSPSHKQLSGTIPANPHLDLNSRMTSSIGSCSRAVCNNSSSLFFNPGLYNQRTSRIQSLLRTYLKSEQMVHQALRSIPVCRSCNWVSQYQADIEHNLHRAPWQFSVLELLLY